MHCLETLQVVTPKYTPYRRGLLEVMQQKFFWGMHPLDRHLPVLMKLQAIQEQNWHLSINAKLFIFLLWRVIHNCILLATVFIIQVSILYFAHIFSGVPCRQSCPAVILAVIMTV